jgi:RNA polymerase sigma-70 factor, ECF subfamily
VGHPAAVALSRRRRSQRAAVYQLPGGALTGSWVTGDAQNRCEIWAAAGQTQRACPGTIVTVSAVRCRETTLEPSALGAGSGKGRAGRDATVTVVRTLDATSRAWLEQLQPEHPRHDQTVAALHSIVRRMARQELARRRRQLPALTGREFDDVAQQAANDALFNVLNKLEAFRGLSRFTTWVYKFVIYEVSTKVAGHAWHRQPPGVRESLWERLSADAGPAPEEALDRRGQLQALRDAIGELTQKQRRVFVSVALNEVPIDAVALELGTNRNAIYKTLFDARQRLRARMAAAGHPVGEVGGGPTCTRDEL